MTNKSTTKTNKEAPKTGPRAVGRNQRRISRTRSRLMESAGAVFAEKGFDLATIDDITEGADVGKGTFYYHFSSMDKLVYAIIQDILGELITRMEKECFGKVRLEEILDAIIGAHISYFGKRWQDFVLYYQGRAELTLGKSYECLENPFREYIESIERHVESTDTGPISEKKLHRIACALAGFTSGYYSFASIAPIGKNLDSELAPFRESFASTLAQFARKNRKRSARRKR